MYLKREWEGWKGTSKKRDNGWVGAFIRLLYTCLDLIGRSFFYYTQNFGSLLLAVRVSILCNIWSLENVVSILELGKSSGIRVTEKCVKGGGGGIQTAEIQVSIETLLVILVSFRSFYLDSIFSIVGLYFLNCRQRTTKREMKEEYGRVGCFDLLTVCNSELYMLSELREFLFSWGKKRG